MARLVLSIIGIMLFGAVLGVHGMPEDDIDVNRPYPYSYVEEVDHDPEPISFLPNAYAHQEMTDSNKMLPFEIKQVVPTTPTPYVGSFASGLRLPALGRAKRAPYYPYYLHWLPHPTRESHYVYDSYLGKVKREAPAPLSYNTKFSSHQ